MVFHWPRRAKWFTTGPFQAYLAEGNSCRQEPRPLAEHISWAGYWLACPPNLGHLGVCNCADLATSLLCSVTNLAPRGLEPEAVELPGTGIVTPDSYTYYDYWRTWAAGYADAFVYHQAMGGTTYDQYYNNEYFFNCNAIGGDCTNFVSQAMHDGGYAPFVNFGVSGSGNWWYDNNDTEP